MTFWSILKICLIYTQLLSIGLGQEDPCYNYKILHDDGGRSVKCSLYHIDLHDRFITEGWRRVQLESTGEDLSMPTQCVPHGFCGSNSNVWLNGNHPTVQDGIVDRMGCLSMFSSCCYVQYPIQIKNCTDYMVYNLKRTYGTDERYCFGDSPDCYLKTTKAPPSSTFSHGYQYGPVFRQKPQFDSQTPSVNQKRRRQIHVSRSAEYKTSFTDNTKRQMHLSKSMNRTISPIKRQTDLKKLRRRIKKLTNKINFLKIKEKSLIATMEEVEDK